jgi:acyl-coenzyme A synthetase/AMP-(fatty) acid ligase
MNFKPNALLNLAFHLWPEREFLVFRGERLTCRQTYSQVKALAAGLHSLGVSQGDRVAVFLPACPEAVFSLFLPSQIGTIHMPINPLLGEQELLEILRHSGARVIFTGLNWYGLQQADLLKRLKPELPELQYVIVLPEARTGGESLPAGDGMLAYEEVLAKGRPYPRFKPNPDDPNLLCYTSGTTGHPKGVLHSNSRSWGFRFGDSWKRLSHQSLQCLLLPYPPYHFSGMFGIMTALIAGGKVVLMDRIDPALMLQIIQTEKVTQIGAPATIYRLMLAAARENSFDLSSVRRLTFSSEKLTPELACSLYDLFHCKLENYYGTTEAHLISWTDTEGAWQSASDSVGWPLPGVEIQIVDQDRQPLSAGEMGEITVRTPQRMLGYYRDPESTDRVLDSNGWIYTGDSGYIGQDKCLHITGRISELINRSGEKILPEEVETFLESHPAIRRAAVIGVPNALAGEEILAFILPQPGKTIDLEEVLRYCRGKIAPYKVPGDIRLVQQLPMTPNGKIQKFRLQETLHA